MAFSQIDQPPSPEMIAHEMVLSKPGAALRKTQFVWRDESVDLICLDPPFNSNASYDALFKAPTGEHSKTL